MAGSILGEGARTEQERLFDGIVRSLEGTDEKFSQFDTHISRVLVAGKYAYKFKKALRLPFLDFSTLEARRFYCQEEWRLNRRLAPQLYIDVVPVTGDVATPVIGGTGPPIEYAVRMQAFDQQALWRFRLTQGLLGPDEVDKLAHRLAQVHAQAPRAGGGTGWGSSQTIGTVFADTLAELSALVKYHDGREALSAVRDWEARQCARLGEVFARRKAQGMIRECHGDLHCGNVLTLNGEVQVFDCIEFNESLRWIDVMDDLAFIHMDLAFCGRRDLAARLLSQYMEISGDYQGLAVLPYYRVHRALVRAKVMLLQACQADVAANGKASLRRDALAYLSFAQACTRRRPAAVMITHGYSGSGKTRFARHVVQLLDAIQLRSDVERKRLHGRQPLYSDTATRRTYDRLRALSRDIVDAGWPVIVDATFLSAAHRDAFRSLAAGMGVPFFIFDLRASRELMASRIAIRQRSGLDASDAGVAILERQIRDAQALDDSASVIVVDMETDMNPERARAACAPVAATLGAT